MTLEPNGTDVEPASRAPRSPVSRIVGFSVWSGAVVGALALVVARPYFFGTGRALLVASVVAWVCGGLVGVCCSPLVLLLLRNRNLMAARPIVLWPTAFVAAVLADVWRDDRVFELLGVAPVLFVAAAFVAWRTLPCIRSVPGMCRFCGYDLRGSVEFGRCPECGRSFESGSLPTEMLPEFVAQGTLHPVFAFFVRRPSIPFIAVVLTLLVSASVGDRRRDHRRELLERGLEVARRTETRFDLAVCTPFEWDAVYVFADCTSAQTIERTLGFRWRDAARSGITIAQRFNLLVFVRGRSVVEYVQVPWKSWFAASDTACRIPRARAVFTIRSTEQGDLQLVTSSTPETGDEAQ